MFSRYTGLAALAAAFMFLQVSQAQTPAFPGAEGFGQYAQGGRGGRVIEVTNLNNEGPGSLRQAAEVDSGPRIVVFRVSGTISLEMYDIEVRHPYLTIAGQTAPGGGITLKDGGLDIRASHVVVRYLRSRPGLASWYVRGTNANGMGVRSYEGVPVHDVVIDHCSMSWTNDDLLYVFNGSDNVTVQWSIISEALECITCSNRGLLVQAKNVTVHHNLYANIYIRWPEITQGNLDFVNNVAYNGNGIETVINPVYDAVKANFVGNYYKHGPNTYEQHLGYASIRTCGDRNYSSSSGIFVQNNVGRYRRNDESPLPWGVATPDANIIWGDGGGIAVQSQRYSYPQVQTSDPYAAYDQVLANAGANVPYRDPVDLRAVNDIKNGTGIWPLDVTDVGGWPTLPSTTPPTDSDHDGMPDSWETSNGFNPNNASDGPQDKDGDGYTNVEEYLNELAGNSPKTAVSPTKPGSASKSIASRRVKQCPLDIFGRTISENSKNSKKQTLTREIMNRKLGQAR